MKKPANISFIERSVHIDRIRNEDIGDWKYYESSNNVHFNIYTGEMKNIDYNFLVLLHEMIEAYLCYRRGITDEQVCEYDANCKDEFPGDNGDAPYHKEHATATAIEAIIAAELGVDWEKYEKAQVKAMKGHK